MVPALFPAALAAQSYDCVLEDGTALSFRIDPNQFVTAVSPEEPIRRKVTVVRINGASTPAEPFRLGAFAGFHADGLGGSSIMFTVSPDGAATYANVRSGERRTGQCEVQ